MLISPSHSFRGGVPGSGFEPERRGGGVAHRSGRVKKILVGNLPFAVSEEELRELFEEHGTVHSVRLVDDRGFGFVEMEDGDAKLAIEELHGKYFAGRILRVEEAK